MSPNFEIFVVSSNEKKFDLEGSDDFNCYFSDTLGKNSSKIRQQMNGGSVMSCIAIGYNGQMDVQFIDYQTNVTMYRNLIQENSKLEIMQLALEVLLICLTVHYLR